MSIYCFPWPITEVIDFVGETTNFGCTAFHGPDLGNLTSSVCHWLVWGQETRSQTQLSPFHHLRRRSLLGIWIWYRLAPWWWDAFGRMQRLDGGYSTLSNLPNMLPSVNVFASTYAFRRLRAYIYKMLCSCPFLHVYTAYLYTYA